MPIFDTAPPDDLGRSGFRLLRTPAGSALLAHVLSEQLVGCKTHFVGNRTIPCEAPDCDPCGSGIGWRWHGYLAVIIDATQEVVIFETTAKAAEIFKEYHQRYKTLRGAHIKAQRLNGRPNGRVLIQARPADLAKINLPQPPDLKKLLCHIWNIAPKQVNVAPQRPRPPFKDLQVDRTKPETNSYPTTVAEMEPELAAAMARRGNTRPARIG